MERYKAMMKAYSVLVLLVFVGLGAIAQAATTVYKWQSADGTWNYTELPPANVKSEKIRVSGSSKKTVAVAPNVAPEGEAESASTPKETTKSAEVAAEDRAINQRNCEAANTNLKNLTSRGRVRYKVEETGEVTYMTDEEKQRRIKTAQEQIQKYCR